MTHPDILDDIAAETRENYGARTPGRFGRTLIALTVVLRRGLVELQQAVAAR